MNQSKIKNLVGTGLCMALGLILPQLFHAIGAGPVFLPMHIPILLCGLCFGWEYGLICGLITPFMSSILTGMPPLFPIGVGMMFELAAYGAIAGLLYRKFNLNIYLALIGSMLVGRLVSGIASTFLFGLAGKAYGFQLFLMGAFVTGLPGIIVQLLIIPFLILALEKSNAINHPTQLKQGDDYGKLSVN